jgi:hypothetical protein
MIDDLERDCIPVLKLDFFTAHVILESLSEFSLIVVDPDP